MIQETIRERLVGFLARFDDLDEFDELMEKADPNNAIGNHGAKLIARAGAEIMLDMLIVHIPKLGKICEKQIEITDDEEPFFAEFKE